MIRAFCGEYLVLPFPLHVMGARCSYGCKYCFAQRPPKSGSKIEDVLKQISRMSANKTSCDITTFLFNKGYDICFSNTTDPFAESNREFTHEFLTWAISNKRGIAFQTKGGKHAMEEIGRMPPSYVYVTVTSDDDAILKEIEPNAPRLQERLELLEFCKKRGDFVEIGINPYFPRLWKTPKKSFEKFREIGIEKIMIQSPHFQGQQNHFLDPEFKKNYADMVKFGTQKKRLREQGPIQALKTFLDSLGFNIDENSISTKGNFWKEYFDLGKPFFPTLDGFVSSLGDKDGKEGITFSFRKFHEWANVFGGNKSSSFKDYICGIGRTLRNKGLSDHAYSAEEFHSLIWDIYNIPSFMAGSRAFAYTGSIVDGERVLERSEDGRPLMVYRDEIDGKCLRFDRYKFVG